MKSLKPQPSRAKRKCADVGAELARYKVYLRQANDNACEMQAAIDVGAACYVQHTSMLDVLCRALEREQDAHLSWRRATVEVIDSKDQILEERNEVWAHIGELESRIRELDRAIDDFRKREAELGLEKSCLAERCEMLDKAARELRRELVGAYDNLDAQIKLNTEHRQNIAQANGQIKELQDSVEKWKVIASLPWWRIGKVR
jgi:chromosome segregation ATPase